MHSIIKWLEAVFTTIPLSLLEGWGRFSYLLGLTLLIAAFGRFTFRPGGRWGIGRERQTWDTKALFCMAFTFVLIFATGYIGSFIVLVPGAQTFESLKDLSVFICILLFGFPALIVVPFAYGLSDLIEGVPPEFLLDWLPGYFINPACFWIAYQFIGKNPDFRQARTWRWYALFVALFMSIEPQLWGYICSGKFTSDISYRTITPALFFTTSLTWVLAPFAMLAAYPFAKKFGLFWAEIPGHAKERLLGHRNWIWQSGRGDTQPGENVDGPTLPIRMFIAAPIITLVLLMVGTVAYLTLRSGEDAASTLASRLHREVAANIDLRLDDYLEKSGAVSQQQKIQAINTLLRNSSVAQQGRAYVIDRAALLIASSAPAGGAMEDGAGLPALANRDVVVQSATRSLLQAVGNLAGLETAIQFRFDVVTAKPLARETWLAQATPYQDRSSQINWIAVTVMPESAYLGGVRAGNSQTAMVLAVALTLSLLIAATMANLMSAPIIRISRSAQSLAEGNLAQRVKSSRLDELNDLAQYFNHMAARLQDSMKNLESEVVEQTRMKEALKLTSDRLQLAARAANIGIWDWNVQTNETFWDGAMFRLYGLNQESFAGDPYQAWTVALHPDDKERTQQQIAAVLHGSAAEFNIEFRVIWPDGSTRSLKSVARVVSQADGKPLRMIGVNFDVSESKRAEEALRNYAVRLQSLSRRLMDAEEQERRRLGRDLHDQTGSNLTAMTLSLQILRSKLPASASGEFEPLIKDIEALLRETMAQLRDVLTDLRPPALDELGLVAALRHHVQRLSAHSDLQFDIEGSEPSPRLRPELEIALFRIAQEAINNAIKHAQASCVTVSIASESGHVVLSIKDNGTGFVPDARQSNRAGLGMTTMNERAEAIGASLAIHAPEIGGTEVAIRVPSRFHATQASKAPDQS
jgi:two-component system sensor histidine kinase/response regulator